MLGMTIIFIYLLGTVRLQDLTAAMVQQMKVPYEYAFMFTAGLRFIPDFVDENRAVAEAQACRGISVKGNFFKQIKRYMSIIRPLMLRSSEEARPWRFRWNFADSADRTEPSWKVWRPKEQTIL